MGAAASTIEAEATKPADASDLKSDEAARAEVNPRFAHAMTTTR
jgi:hypothetical protein